MEMKSNSSSAPNSDLYRTGYSDRRKPTHKNNCTVTQYTRCTEQGEVNNPFLLMS